MNNYKTKTHTKNFKKKEYEFFVIGADIGGTNMNFGLSGVKNGNIELISSVHFKTLNFKNISEPLTTAVDYFREKYKINNFKGAAVAAAGPVLNREYCKLTNADFEIKKEEIEKIACCKGIVINDFSAVGFGINLLKNKDLIKISKNVKDYRNKKGVMAVIGAGTGLGESILVFDQNLGFYVPLPSEGGHSDFPAENRFEYDMSDFIKEKNEIPGSVFYEDFISGRGIENIYSFLKHKKFYPGSEYTKIIDSEDKKAPVIAKYSGKDRTCKKTMEIFIKFYAKCARNFALTILPEKLYIAGGIAQKNILWFQKDLFISEFENHKTYSKILKKIPVYIIKNYNTGLHGACFAAANLDMGEIFKK